MYTTNAICGVFEGPGVSGITSTVSCSTTLIGRYVTLQRIGIPDIIALNFVEILIESTPETEKIEIFLQSTAATDGQCPSSYPYAYASGDKCCSRNVDEDRQPGWEGKGSMGFLHFDSTGCAGNNSVMCANPPCMNYLYQRYGCYMEDVDLTTKDVLGYGPTDNPEKCEELALNTPGANGFVWTKKEFIGNSGICYPKSGDVKPIPDFTILAWAAILPCP